MISCVCSADLKEYYFFLCTKSHHKASLTVLTQNYMSVKYERFVCSQLTDKQHAIKQICLNFKTYESIKRQL